MVDRSGWKENRGTVRWDLMSTRGETYDASILSTSAMWKHKIEARAR